MPALNVPDPRTVVPFRNCTVPVGAVPVITVLTEAVNVMLVPTVVDLAEAVSVTAGVTLVGVTVTAFEVDPLKVKSPE